MVSEWALWGMAHLLRWLSVAEHELLLFATFWFVISAIDEAAVDISWLWLRLGGRAGAGRVPAGLAESPLLGRAAILVPAWHEDEVIGDMVAHTLKAWVQREFTIYVGCYRNDHATLAAACAGAGGDPRVRIVVNPVDGPTTKADCLNYLHDALIAYEHATRQTAKAIVLHDAEDVVHPCELMLLQQRLFSKTF